MYEFVNNGSLFQKKHHGHIFVQMQSGAHCERATVSRTAALLSAHDLRLSSSVKQEG